MSDIFNEILNKNTSTEDGYKPYEGDGWDNFKNNLYNTFEMSGDVLEFYFGDGEGAQSSLNIASSLIYESIFGKDNIKSYNETDFGKWFAIASTDSPEFQTMIENFQIEQKDRKQTMTFAEADSFTDYLSVAAGAVVNVGGSVVYNLGTVGTGFFMEFASDNFIEANKVKADSMNMTLDELLQSGEADASAALKIAALQAGLEYVGFKKIMKPLKGTGLDKTYKKAVGNYLTKFYQKNKNIRIGLDIFSTGGTEALTEMSQTGLEIYNKELAVSKSKGEEINPFLSVGRGMFSPEGIEAGLQGFFGGGGLKGTAYSAKALNNIRKSNKELDVEQELSNLVSLTKRYNQSKDPDVKEALDKEIKSTEKLLKNKIKKGNDLYNSLSNNDIKEIENLSDLADVAAFRTNQLIERFKKGEISEEDFNLAVKGLSDQYNKNKDGIIDILYQRNLEFAKTEAEKIGKEVIEIQTKEEFQQEYDKIRGEEDFKGDVTDTDGFIKGDKIYINALTAKESGAISVGSHELLHGIIGNYVDELSDVDRVKLGKQFISTLNSEQENAVRRRLKENYGLEGDAIYSKTGVNEMFTALSDAVEKGEVTFNETFGQQLKFALQDFIRAIIKAMPGVEVDYTKEFADGRQAYNFLKGYSKNIKEGKLGKRALAFAKQTKEAEGVKFIKDSRSKAVDAVNQMEQGATTKEEFQKPGIFNNIYNSITQDGGAINNYVKSLGLSKEKFQETIDSLSDRLMNYDPAAQRKTKSGEKVTIGEFLMANIGFAKLDAAKKLAIEAKKEGKTKRIDAAKKTKEGEATFDIEDTDASVQEILDEQDMSVEGVAKREAKENKAKKKRNSKLRQELGFETDGDAYNKVLDSARKSLLLAYKKTTNIKDAKARVDKIVQLLKKEYNSLTSDLFKPLKNFLGVKDYLSNLKTFKEAIVESISTADLVQMERNVPDADKVFVVFERQLTTKKEVQDAIDKNLLPKDDLNRVSKGPVNLYKKVMPTDNEIVGFADQPAINPETGQRSGLKGTRKDGFAKRIAETLILDAIMEVRQETEVQKTLTEDLNVEMDVQQLASKIGRDVNVKFSKSNAVADIDNAIDVGTDTGVYLQVRFSKSHREQYENRLKKNRTDLTEEQRKNAVQSVFDFVDSKDIPNNKKSKYEKMAMHYMANGHLILPEDGYKVIEVERLAAKNKIDPFSVKDPNALIQTYVEDSKTKRTDPDKVKTFSNKTEWSNGVVVYDVEDSKQGQEDVRKVADTHFGKKFQNWCLIHRDKSETTRIETIRDKTEAITFRQGLEEQGYIINRFEKFDDTKISVNNTIIGGPFYEIEFSAPNKADNLSNAFDHWKSYNQEGNGHKVAFHNGKLVAFRDGNQMNWWDINDNPTKSVVVKGKKVGDGFREVVQVEKNKSTVLHTEKQTGDKKNGTYTKKNLDGNIVEIITKKDNFKYGKQFKQIEKTYHTAEITTFYNTKSFNRGYDITSREEVRIYKKFKGKSKGENLTAGKDQLRLDNITKWQRNTIVTNAGTQDPGARLTTTIVEGTVNQDTFEEAKNPDAITDPFIKKNLKYLVVSNERYFPLQGKKVSVKHVEGANVWDNVLTIDNEVQETRVRFSRSANNEASYNLKNSSVKFSKTKVKQRDKTIQKLAIEIDKLEEDTSQKFLYETLLFNLSKQDISYEEAVNITVDAVNKKYDNNVGLEVKNILSEGILTKENVNSVVDGFKNITLEELRIESLPLLAKAYNKIFNDPDISIDQKINVLLNFIGIVGRSTRSGKNTPLRTNKMLFDWIENNFALPKEIIEKLKPVTFDGYNKKNISKILYDGKEINKYLHTDTIRRKLTSNKNVQEILQTIESQAKEAMSTMLNILKKGSRFTLEEKLAFIERTFLDQMGMMRKTYPPGFYMFGEQYNEKNTKLEHNPPVAEAKEIWKQYAKGQISEQDVLDWYKNNNASVNVVSNEINKALTKAGLSQSRKGLADRMEHPSVKPLVDDAVSKKQVGNYKQQEKNNNFENLEKYNKLTRFSRSTKNPTKGITILDFDDTLATSSSLIRYTRPDGTTGTLTPEQYASTYEDLLGLGYEFDFSEFNKVVDGKPAPLLNKAKKLAGKFGTKNMFILTARPQESAVAIQKFLKENGLDIPIENITGLGNSTAEAKALWVLDKAAEGYNDFYFADDAIQNVQAVQNMLDQIDVKSKVQQARVKFSKSDIKTLKESKVYKKFSNGLKGKKLYHGGNKIVSKIPGVKNEEYLTWFWNNDQQGAEMHIDAMSENPIYANLPIYEVDFNSINESHVIFPDFEYIPYTVIKEAVDRVYPEGRTPTKTKKKYADKREQKLRDKRLEESKTWRGSDYGAAEIMSDPKAMEILEYFLEWSFKNPELYEDYTGLPFYENGEISIGLPVIALGAIPSNKRSLVDPKDYKMTPTVRFSKSSLRNNKAVNNLLSQIDVKSKVQRARVKFSKSMDKDFNNILEDVSGIDSKKRFSEAKARRRGRSKGKFRYFVPPSHEDFIGLLYNFMGKGEKGNQHRNFFEKSLVRPLNRAYRALNAAKQAIANDYRALIKGMPEVRKKLGEKILKGDYTHEDAIRVYLWDKAGFKIPGLSKTDQKKLSDFVKNDPALQSFADALGVISKDKDGYVKPSDNWDMGGIKYDLIDATGRIGRAQFFQEFIENADIIFSEENLNKIEAIYGEDFRSALEDMLYRVTNGTNRPTGKNKIVNRWIDWINGSVGATMFFNARSAILQQLSFVNFMNFADNNIFKAAKAFANQPQFWADFAMIFNSDYLKQRRTGAGFDVNASEIAREVSGSKQPVRAAIRYLLNLGFLPTQMGDSFAIAIGGASFLRNRINTYLKQGLSQKEAESKAFIDFQEIAEETQQSARPDMISQQQASFLGRFVLAFQNVTSQYVRIMKKSGLDLINRRISKGYTSQAQSDMANVSRIMYYGAIQSVIFYGLQSALFAMMFDDDEQDEEFFEKKKDRIIHGTIDSILRGMGVYGAIVSTIKNTAKKYLENQKSDSWFKSEAWPELLQISPPVGIKVRKIRGAERTADWNKDVMKEMETFDIDNPLWDAVTSTIEGVTNVPLNRLHRKIQNLRAASDSENAWWQRVAVALGWSKWDVGIENKEVEEVRKKIKKDKSKKKKTKEEQIQEKENEQKQKKERKEGKETTCIAVTSKGSRCSNKPEGNGKYCTIHAKVEQNESGEKKQCKKTKSDGKRCKMQTNSKSGYCYYHD